MEEEETSAPQKGKSRNGLLRSFEDHKAEWIGALIGALTLFVLWRNSQQPAATSPSGSSSNIVPMPVGTGGGMVVLPGAASTPTSPASQPAGIPSLGPIAPFVQASGPVLASNPASSTTQPVSSTSANVAPFVPPPDFTMLNDVNGIPSVQGLPSGLHLFQNMGNGTYVGIPSWTAFQQLANSTPNAQVAFANPNNTTLMQAINSGQTVFNANQLENTEANAYYAATPA